MSLHINAAIWQSCINAILTSIPNKSKYLANMNDLLQTFSTHSHLKYLKDILKAFTNNGLKISP